MDNHQMKVDSYGRFSHVPEYPEVPWDQPQPCETWASAERMKRLEDTVTSNTYEIDWIKTHIDNLQGRVSVLEITPLVPVEDHPPTWVEEELENIKNMPSERVCSSCKWGVFEEINRDEVWCHYDPEGMGRPPYYWCSHWCSK